MPDIILQNIWQDIKDPSWPMIETYDDFLKMPDDIREECIKIHGLPKHLAQALEPWNLEGQYLNVYRHKNLAFVPVLKCGHLYWHDLFVDRMSWEECHFTSQETDQMIKFGVIMHPLHRWLKGTTEWIWRNWRETNEFEQIISPGKEKTLLQTKILDMINTAIIGDKHTVPYHIQFGPLLDQINWIPLGLYDDEQVKKIMMSLFIKHKHNITLPIQDARQHVSDSKKLSLYSIIKEIYLSDRQHQRVLYNLYSQDLKFYHNLLDTFKPNWSHLN